MAHPSPLALEIFGGTADAHYNDLGNFDNLEAYKPMLEQVGFAQLLSELWRPSMSGTSEKNFLSKRGKAGLSPWHQDTAYIAATGDRLVNVWMSFESLPKGNSFELVRGSHTGPQYDGSAYQGPHDPTKRVRGEKWFPRLPDIEAEREAKLTLLDSNEGFASRLIGTPDTILLRMQDFHHLGIDCFLLSLHDKLFNGEVLPALRHL